MSNANRAAGATAQANSLTPTSSLPFAARACDIPYLGAAEDGARLAINKMASHGVDDSAVCFAEIMNEQNLQLKAWADVLKSVGEHLKWAERGASPNGLNAYSCFSQACSMLSLAETQIKRMAVETGSELDEFCNQMAASTQTTNSERV